MFYVKTFLKSHFLISLIHYLILLQIPLNLNIYLIGIIPKSVHIRSHPSHSIHRCITCY